MKARRIPVWLVTGYLGSGKTTLLASWLRDPALADAALIVNEIGEVGLDDRTLGASTDTGTLVANACVCCTGLPGLEQALAELFWDRLQRRRPHFGSVVIETTGLADPGSVIAAFERVPLLRERYTLEAVLTAASAVAGMGLIEAHPEARAQVAWADAVIVTKSDCADGAALASALRSVNPHAGIGLSSQGSLGWPEVRGLVRAQHRQPANESDSEHEHDHAAVAQFLPMPQAMTLQQLHQWVGTLRHPGLLRLKGVVRLADGAHWAVQWSLGDASASVTAFDGRAPALGLTRISIRSA